MEDINNIPKEKFQFVTDRDVTHDKKLESKPVGYFKDAFRRFCKNKSSIVGAVIIIFLILFSLIAPFVTSYSISDTDGNYAYAYPKISVNASGGFWDGTKKHQVGTAAYQRYLGIGMESGRKAVVKTYSVEEVTTTTVSGGQSTTTTSTSYTFRLDTYYAVGYKYMELTFAKYNALLEYQNETGIQVIYPMVDYSNTDTVFDTSTASSDANYWYVTYTKATDGHTKGEAVLDDEGNFIPNYRLSGRDGVYYNEETGKYAQAAVYDSLRLESDPAYGLSADEASEVSDRYRYARTTSGGVMVRVCYYDYYVYLNGIEPVFIFGANSSGQDLFVMVASGTRFSLILALGVAIINLILGAIYGSIEGYYGGTADLVMERISDILSGVPFMVVTVLFQMYLAESVGAIGSLIFAFILTGWIGTASTVRMQFYRFKKQEYVLAARTLGARDRRLIMKHIFPNAAGTMITSFALYIPSVIFSETSLSYLGIINLDNPASGITSLGTLLTAGQSAMGLGYFHPILFPSLVISLLMISFNLFGNGLRDAFNPTLRGSEG